MKPFEGHPKSYDQCPKCGDTGIVGWSSQWSVEYDVFEEIGEERLLWKCRTCGYVIATEPKDAS